MLFTIPIALAPIGGAVSTFGLHLPFLVAAAVAFCGLLMSLRFMEEASAIKQRASKKKQALYEAVATTPAPSESDKVDEPSPATGIDAADVPRVTVVPTEPPAAPEDADKRSKHDDDGEAPTTPTSTGATAATSDGNQSPWADPVLLVLGTGFFFIGVLSVGMMLLPPLLFAADTYGLQQSTVSETQEKISITVGLMSVCSGVSMVFFMYVGYLWLAKKVSVLPVIDF